MMLSKFTFICIIAFIYFKISCVLTGTPYSQSKNLSETENDENGTGIINISASFDTKESFNEYCPKKQVGGYTDNLCISYCWWNGFQGGRCTDDNFCLCNWEDILDQLNIPKRQQSKPDISEVKPAFDDEKQLDSEAESKNNSTISTSIRTTPVTTDIEKPVPNKVRSEKCKNDSEECSPNNREVDVTDEKELSESTTSSNHSAVEYPEKNIKMLQDKTLGQIGKTNRLIGSENMTKLEENTNEHTTVLNETFNNQTEYNEPKNKNDEGNDVISEPIVIIINTKKDTAAINGVSGNGTKLAKSK